MLCMTALKSGGRVACGFPGVYTARPSCPNQLLKASWLADCPLLLSKAESVVFF